MKKRVIKKAAIMCLLVALVLNTTVFAYAEQDTDKIDYTYKTSHLMFPTGDYPTLTVNVTLGAIFHYYKSNTQGRTFFQEDYYMIGSSPSGDAVKTEVSCSMGTLEVYTDAGSVLRCPEVAPYYGVLTSPDWFYDGVTSDINFRAGASGTSYGQLGYMITGDAFITRSGVAKFEKLGSATGNVTVNSNNDEIKFTEEEVNELTALIKEKMNGERKLKNKNDGMDDERKAIIAYAKENGIEVSDEEVEACILNVLKDYPNTVEYKLCEQACAAAGTTFEEFVRNDFEAYRDYLVVEKVHKSFSEQYPESKDAEEGWKAFKTQLVDKFIETK